MAIKSFRHKGLKRLFYDDDRSKVSPDHVDMLLDIMDSLAASHHPKDMRAIFQADFSEKKGGGKGVYAVRVSGNWRVTYQISDDGAVLLDYLDDHGKTIRAK